MKPTFFSVKIYDGLDEVGRLGKVTLGKSMILGFQDQEFETLAGWWFGTFFPYVGNNHPN